VRGAGPLVHLGADREGPYPYPDAAGVVVPGPDPSAVQVRLVGDYALQPLALILDRPVVLDPGHPDAQPLSVLFDGRPDRVQIVHRVSADQKTLAQFDRERAHT